MGRPGLNWSRRAAVYAGLRACGSSDGSGRREEYGEVSLGSRGAVDRRPLQCGVVQALNAGRRLCHILTSRRHDGLSEGVGWVARLLRGHRALAEPGLLAGSPAAAERAPDNAPCPYGAVKSSFFPHRKKNRARGCAESHYRQHITGTSIDRHRGDVARITALAARRGTGPWTATTRAGLP